MKFPSAVDSVQAEIFLGFTTTGNAVRIGVDSYCEGTLISSSVVSSDAIIHPSPINMKGIGGSQGSPGYVLIPLRLQWGAQLDTIAAYVVDPGVIPQNVDVLFGLDVQRDLDISIDTPSHLLFVRSQSLEIPTEPPAVINARLTSAPITVVATNSGVSFAYCMLRNLGFRVSAWYTTEIDPTALAVAAQIVPSDQLRPLGDTLNATAALTGIFAHLHISTPPCVAWSSCRGNAQGFKDPSAQIFRASAAIHDILRATNPQIQVLVENVPPHSGLPDDLQHMANLWHVPFRTLQALDLGSPASRNRVFGTDIVNISDLLYRRNRPDPNRFLNDPLVYCDKPHFPCLVASDTNTHQYPKARFRCPSTTPDRRLHIVEAEAIQGWPQQITDGVQEPLNLTRAQRIRILGNGLNAWHLHAILRHLKIPAPRSLNTCASVMAEPAWRSPSEFDPTDTGASEFQTYLNTLDDHKLALWFKHQLATYVLPELELQIKPGVGPYAKPTHAYRTPSRLNEAVNYACDHMIREGYYEELFHVDHRHWITNAFVKMKETFWNGTAILKARILGDFRPLNSWLQPPPAHWTWASPDQATMMSSFPRGSEFFLLCDIADAYHTCRLAEASQNLVVISINGRYFKYKGGAQGLAPMALFWNCHIQDAFFAAFGLHWRKWWATFVDDIGVHGFTAAVTTARANSFISVDSSQKNAHIWFCQD